jgi:hypothetical protein
MVEHRDSGPFRIAQLGVFGVASKSEVGKQVPVLEWLKLLEEGCPYSLSGIDKGLSIDRNRIGQNDTEVEHRIPAPVGSYVVADTHHLGAKGPDELIHGLLDFGLTDKAGWNVHKTIIAPPGRGRCA